MVGRFQNPFGAEPGMIALPQAAALHGSSTEPAKSQVIHRMRFATRQLCSRTHAALQESTCQLHSARQKRKGAGAMQGLQALIWTGVLVIGLPLISQGADYYRCLDDQGQVSFSDQRCPNGERLRLEPANSLPAPSIQY